MTPDTEVKCLGSPQERPLLANVVRAHHKQSFVLFSICFTHDSDQRGNGIVLQQQGLASQSGSQLAHGLIVSSHNI